MKVGFLIIDLSCGGAEQATCGISGYLADNEVDTTILTINDCVPFYDVSDKVKLVSLSCKDISRKPGLNRIVDSIKKAFYIRKKIKQMGFDLIVGMSNSICYYLLFSTLFTKTKCIGAERSDPYSLENDPINRILKKLTGKLSDGYVFQTKRQQSYYPAPRCKITAVIPNAVFNRYAYISGLPEKREKTVTAVGRLSAEKRYGDIIRAFSIFSQKHKDFSLQIFGAGNERENIENLINSLDIADKVVINEPRKDAIATVAKSSLYVLCSGFEGFPNALLEALHCGVPSIASDCSPAIRELITDRESGIIFKVGDVDTLAEAMDRIVSDIKLSKKLSQNAYSQTKKYDLESIGRKWIEYFEYVLSN